MDEFDIIKELREAAARQRQIVREPDPMWLNPDQRRCEAVIKGLAAWRTDNLLQCSRPGYEEEHSAGAFLCFQHYDLALRYQKLELYGRRFFVIQWEWSTDRMRRNPLGAEIIEDYLDPDTVWRERAQGPNLG